MKFVLPSAAVIAFGSNLGDRGATLDAAIAELGATPGITVTAVSAYRETVALTTNGYDDSAPRYVNAVVLVDTILDPERLLDACQAIEDAHGRVRVEKWGSRTLDLDIIDYAGIRYETDRLILPHPHAHERDFVLGPWHEVDPAAVLPGTGPVAEALTALADAQAAS